MRRLISLFLIPLFNLYAAFNAATAWDVRTTAADTNGGGWQVGSTGTDRSQSDLPFQVYTDIVIGATTTQGTSVLHPFDATTVGNIINITAGANCTVQRVQAVSQAAGVVTFDKSLGTAASTCTGNLGGALATPPLAASLAIAGNTIYVQSGTYTTTASMTLTGGTTLATRTAVIGYNATHGDMGTRPLITTATNATPIFLGTTSNAQIYFLQNLSLSNTAAVRAAGVGDPGGGGARTTFWMVDSSIFDGFSAAIGDSNVNFRLDVSVHRFEIKNSTTNGIAARGGLWILDSNLHDNTGTVLWTPNISGLTYGASLYIINSLIVDGTGIGISLATPTAGPNHVRIIGNTIANHTSHGVSNANALSDWIFENNILYGNGGWGAINSVTIPITMLNNLAYGANSLGDLSGFTASATDVSLAADPFTNSAGNDYSLNSAAGGGAACKSAGYPGLFLGSSTTGYPAIGAVEAAAGAAAAAHGSAFVQ